jgi:hypothetical protein
MAESTTILENILHLGFYFFTNMISSISISLGVRYEIFLTLLLIVISVYDLIELDVKGISY